MDEIEKAAAEIYRGQLKNAVAGKIRRNELVTLGRASRWYIQRGLSDGPVIFPQKVIKKALDLSVNNHNVPLETLERLPELLKTPMMMFKSISQEGSLVVIVDGKDKSGRPILVAIEPGTKWPFQNTIRSVHGRDNFDQFVNKNIDAHTALYVDKKKALNSVSTAELQLLGGDTAKNLMNIISHTSTEMSSGFGENVDR